jgi:type II secretion system protein H
MSRRSSTGTIPFFRPARPASMRGFSLVELMVVVVIMAVMAALIVPAMRGTMEAERLRGAGRQILQSLHLAYSQSITQRQPHRWHFDPGSGRYQVERPDRTGSAPSPFVPVMGLPQSQGLLDRRITVEIRPATTMAVFDLDRNQPATPAFETSPSDDPNAVAFFPDGTAQAREIVLRDQDGFEQILRVNPITAQVTLIATRREVRPRP